MTVKKMLQDQGKEILSPVKIKIAAEEIGCELLVLVIVTVQDKIKQIL